jgi:alkanesulfonate monooxygenase SsuD/methylene tetrahydromethanopterin reductase-like flavin-dependent oxidoreductase (luciferase family)
MKFGFFIMGTQSGTYLDILDQIEYAEELGFEEVWLAERHFHHTPLLWSSPLTIASYIAARTKKIRIGLAARILPFHHPLHVAEDVATVDVLSQGRFNFGITRAGLDELFHQVFQAPLEETRDRFKEALDIILQAWTQSKVSYQGKYYQIPEVTVLPKPFQKPHPPIFMVANTPESIQYAAQQKYPIFINGAQRIPEMQTNQNIYWKAFDGMGYDRSEVTLLVNRFLYVADNTIQAREEMEKPFMTFIHEKAPDLKQFLIRKYGDRGLDFDFLADNICIFGDPDYCVGRLKELEKQIDLRYLLCTLNLITQEHDLCVKSMERFARHVMPYFQ